MQKTKVFLRFAQIPVLCQEIMQVSSVLAISFLINVFMAPALIPVSWV